MASKFLQVALLLAIVCLPTWAQAPERSASAATKELPRVSPEDVGMSTARLERINHMMQRHIDAGRIQGGITVVARQGKVVHFQTHGLMDVDAKTPMREDAVFRMASSTKPVVGVAIMMLIEEGLVRPSDKVSQFIPEFAAMQVAVRKDGKDPLTPIPRGETPEYELVPAEREITVHDLLTHTSGLLSGGLGSAVAELDRRQAGDTLETAIPRLAAAPLDFQPGTRWAYSAGAGIDTLGRIVEIASGKPFDVFLRERVFEPLGMSSTFFDMPESEAGRLVKIMGRSGATGASTGPVTYFSGAGGLRSAAKDYLHFEQMLLNGGELFGNRLLSPRTVAMMASNQVGDLYRGLGRNERGMGFGYTVAVVEDPVIADSRRGKGAFGWGGAYGTMSWTDPAEQIVAVIMLQQRVPQVQDDFENAIRQAIIE